MIARSLAVSITLALALASAVCAQYDFAAEAEDLTAPGETVQQAADAARQAVQSSRMKMTVSAIGFDIPPGSEAERYLQDTARIGGGGYFTAAAGGQLSQIMGAAASGQTGIAGGSDAVSLTRPKHGDTVGPSIEIAGKTGPEALVVIYTAVHRDDTGEKLKEVPGIRHKAEVSGDFSFRIATPRVSFGSRDVRVRYEIHAYVLRADGTKGPETVVTVLGPQP